MKAALMDSVMNRTARWTAPMGAPPSHERNSEFEQTLRAAQRGQRHPAETREAATKLVASAFVIPILEELRSANMAEAPFAPGDAERRFGPLLDVQIADQIISAANFRIVDDIVARYGSMASERGAMRQEAIDGRG
jgi:hypothetical protein